MREPIVSPFEKATRSHRDRGLLGECWGFLCQNKKWWLLPLLIVFFAFGALVWLAGTGAGPFLYTLF